MSNILSTIRERKNIITIIHGILIALFIHPPLYSYSSSKFSNHYLRGASYLITEKKEAIIETDKLSYGNESKDLSLVSKAEKIDLNSDKGKFGASNEEIFENLVLDQMFISESIIGREGNLPDNVKDNIFNFEVSSNDIIESLHKVTFDVFGLHDITSIPISINANQSIGGKVYNINNVWKTVTFFINPKELKEGMNYLSFYAPSYDISYRVKNIMLSKTDISHLPKLNLNGIKFYQKNKLNKIALTGFFDTELYDLFINGNKQDVSNHSFELTQNLFQEEIGYVLLELKDKKGQIIEKRIENYNLTAEVIEAETSVLYASKMAIPKFQTIIELDEAKLIITPSALEEQTKITISKLCVKDIMPMPSGIKNVTKDRAAYRFLPDGIVFKDSVIVEIPFDENLLPVNFDKKKMVTMYFDVKKRHWESIRIDSVDMVRKCVIAKTNHFTDYVNGVIQVPESPEVSAFVPTVMSDIKAADPSAEMILMRPPTASQTGEASISYTIKIPAGRLGMQPNISINYNSDGGTSWLGEGWNIAKQGISIDTRWGMPTFNPNSESEIYSLLGEQLMYPKNPGSEYEYMPHRHEGELGQSNLTTELQPRNSNGTKEFTFRKQDSFSKIERLGTSPSTYYWKITSSSGIVQWYGGDESGLKSTHTLHQSNGNIFYWALVKTVDLHGNTVTYSYDKGIYNNGVSNLNGGTYFYLSNINYTGSNEALGNYDVAFIKQNTLKHNPSIYAKNGLKEVDPFLLDNIQVKHNQEVIRTYKFQYFTGQFEKILLKRLIEYDSNNNEFHRHEFDYHNDFLRNNGNLFYESKRVHYPPFSPNYTLNFGNAINASKLGSAQSIDYGFNIRPAAGLEIKIPRHSNRPNRTITVGLPHHWNFSSGRGRVSLVDMDGDGLDDIVYRTTNGIKYIPNKITRIDNDDSTASSFHTGLINFYIESPTENVISISDFSKSKGQNYTPLLQTFSLEFKNFFFGFKNIKSFNESDIFFIDANSDGFVDIVRDGIVYFNCKDESGQTKFFPSSALSENLLITASQPEIEPVPENQDNNLLFNYDAIKVWTAPTSARIEIKDILELSNPTADAYALYTVELIRKDKANGGYYSPCRLYLAELDYLNPFHAYAIDESTNIPLGCNERVINVETGDLIIFRLHKNEGNNFEVMCSPTISFLSTDNIIYDSNNNAINQTGYQESFTLSGVETFTSQGNGNVNINWNNIILHNLSSNIQFIIRKVPLDSQDEGEVIFLKNYMANTPNDVLSVNANSVPLNLSQIPVALDDEIYVEIKSDSNINWEILNWFPNLTYTATSEDFQSGNINVSKVLIPSKTIHKLESFEGNLSLGQLSCSTNTPINIAVKPNTTLLSGANNLLTAEDNGFFRLVIKSNQQLIKTYNFIIQQGSVSLQDDTPVTIFDGYLDSNAPNIYFDFYADGKLNFEILNKYLSSINKRYLVYLNGTLSNNLSELNCSQAYFFNWVNIYTNYYSLFGPNYNNWGQFFYNPHADEDSSTPNDQYGKLINSQYLNMDSYNFEFNACDGITDSQEYEDCVENFINNTIPQNPEDITDPEGLSTLLPNGNVNLAIFVARPYVDLSNNIYRYIGLGEDIYCSKDGWKTGDLKFGGSFNDDLEEYPAQPADSFTGMYATKRYSSSLSRSISVGWGPFSLGRSWTIYSRSIKDFVDVNGDGYPDILQENSFNLTNQTGGHFPNSNTSFYGNVDSVDSHTIGLTATRGFPIAGRRSTPFKFEKNIFGTGSITHIADKNSGESIGITAGLNVLSENKSNEFLIDLNGDGIPDKVYKDGNMLKYKFTTFSHGGESFSGLTSPNSFPNPISINVGIGTSFQNVYNNLSNGIENASSSFFSGSINLGLGGNKGNTQVTYRDLNGDGLVDIINDGSVYYNLGNRFSNTPQPLSASHGSSIFGGLSLGDDSKSTNLALAGNLSFFLGYPICCPLPFVGFIPMLHVKPFGITIGGEVSLNINESLKDFKDMNGDGFIDYVQDNSDGSNSYIVYYSAIGKTNKLSKVTNSLRGSFELDYSPFEKTKKSPYAKWVLSKVKTDDGYDMEFAGVNDGADISVVYYDYSSPYYDRREREFYGYGEVIIKEWANDPVQPFRKTNLNYHNTNYFLRGLLKSTIISSGQQMFSHKINTYQIRKLDLANQHILPIDLPETFDVGGTEGRRSASVLLKQTKEIIFENGGQLTKEIEFDYDSKGRVIKYDFKGNPNDNSDDYYSIIDYHSSPQLIQKNILNIPKSIRVFDNQGQLKRKRATTNINLNNGLIGTYQSFLNNIPIETNVEYYANGNLKKIIAPFNESGHQKTIEYTYDAQNSKYIIETLDNLGYSSSYSYDPKFDKILLTTDIAGNTMNFSYDNFGRLIKILAPKEAEENLPYTIRFDYHPTYNTLPSISGLNVSNFVPVARTQHYDSFNIGNDIETLTFVDGFGRPIAVKKDIQIGEQEYMSVSGMTLLDFLGRTLKEYQPRYQPKDLSMNYLCDSQSFGISDLNGTIDASTPQFFREYTYDMRDRAILVSDFDSNSIVETQFSIENGLFKIKTITAQNENNQIISELFKDVNGRTTKSVQVGDDTLETNFEYNSIGELMAYTDADNLQTLYSYDGLGRKLSVNHPNNGTTKYYYDNANNLIRLQTQKLINEGQYITYHYDELNRLISQIFPNIANTSNIANTAYKYAGPGSGNQSGRLIYIQDATGWQQFEYGNLGEMTLNERYVISPSSSYSDQYFMTEYTYDSWNRVKHITYPDGETVSYNYDKGGNLLSVEGTQVYVANINYDHFEQRTSITYGNGTTTNYSYTPEMRRLQNLQLEVNGGQLQDLNYDFDFIGNVTNITNNASPVNQIGGYYSHRYSYDTFNRLVQARGRFEGEQTSNNNHSAKYDLRMSYNYTHGILSKTQSHYLDGNVNVQNTYDNLYTYDNGNHQVTSILNQSNGDLQYFKYDANGNIIMHYKEQNTQHYLWDEANRLRVVYSQNNIQHNIFDAAGERVIKAVGNVSNTYQNGQLADSNVDFESLIFYPNGLLVADVSDHSYTKHYYAGSQRIAARLQSDNNYQKTKEDALSSPKHLKGGALHNDLLQRLAQNQINIKIRTIKPEEQQGTTPNATESYQNSGDELYFYHPDHLGSATFLTDHEGLPYQFFLNLPFGESMAEQRSYTGSFDNRWKFTGKELDEDTGLYYFGARFYNPSTSIWLSVDPLAEKYASWSPYNYTLNNPILYIDPDGREVIISGALSDDALQQLQGRMKDRITLSMDKDGKLSYTVNEGQKLKGNAKRMANMIDDKSITVNLITTDKNETSTGNLMTGGAFMGNTVTTDADGNKTVDAYQEVNPNVLGSADAHTNTQGKMMMHEATEAYAGAQISKKSGVSAGPATQADASNPRSVYSKAHRKATSQTPVYQTLYDTNGNVTTDVTQAVRVEWSVTNRNKSKVIQSYP